MVRNTDLKGWKTSEKETGKVLRIIQIQKELDEKLKEVRELRKELQNLTNNKKYKQGGKK